jgi:hypothetical protein
VGGWVSGWVGGVPTNDTTVLAWAGLGSVASCCTRRAQLHQLCCRCSVMRVWLYAACLPARPPACLQDADPAKTLSCPRTKVGDRLGRFIVNRLKVGDQHQHGWHADVRGALGGNWGRAARQ